MSFCAGLLAELLGSSSLSMLLPERENQQNTNPDHAHSMRSDAEHRRLTVLENETDVCQRNDKHRGKQEW